MSYEPTIWENGKTPINADNLNKIENELSLLSTNTEALQGEVDEAKADINTLQSKVATLESEPFVDTEAREEVATVKNDILNLDARVDQIANNQIPEEYLQASINNFIANNESGLATKTDLTELDNKLSNEISNANDNLEVFKDDIHFLKQSENLLDENNIYLNNAIVTKSGGISADNRGFRIYVLEVGKGNTVTVSIDQNWFYGIQANLNIASIGSVINEVDTGTYFDTSSQSLKTSKTITMLHDYLFLCFLPKEPNSSLPLCTSKIMANVGSVAKEYSPYKLSISVDVQNDRYEKLIDFGIFENAYINNCELVANEIEPTPQGAVAQYTAVKMPNKVISVKAKVKFYGNAYSTFIAEPNGMCSVNDVTNKSVHINISRTVCHIGYFIGNSLTNTKEINYSVPEGVECAVGFDYDVPSKTLTVYLPNGETYSEVNETYYDCTGCYAIWEHYKSNVSNGFKYNHLTKIYAKDEDGNILCDNFKRGNGAVGISPQGYVYAQFTSLNQRGWSFN